MSITTAILLLAGASVMIFSSTIRPEPKPFPAPESFGAPDFSETNLPKNYSDEELKNFIASDRKEGNARLLITLISVGVMVEIIVFITSCYLSEKIVSPVKDSYNKQKTFIANASHELKTPLAVIEANIEALDVDEENEAWKNNIETEITHANKLVLDLLQLAKMDAGTLAKNPSEKINLEKTIKERIDIFKPKFKGKITFRNETNDPNYTLVKQDFLQILDILLDNATKYGDKKTRFSLNKKNLSLKMMERR